MRKPAILAVLVTTAGAVLAANPVQDARTSLAALNDRFNAAVAAHDAEALIDLYAEDTLWIAQGDPVTRGLEGPRQLFGFVTANKGEVTHTIDHLMISDDASLAVMIGSVDARVEKTGLDATGTYLFVLKPDGSGWKVVTDMWHQHDPG